MDIKEICKKYDIENYRINDDGTVDVNGSVNLSSRGLNKLPLKFGKVTGSFYCHTNKLTSLEGSPRWVGVDFSCDSNQLTSLVGGPKVIGRDIWVSDNKLITLKGSPHEVGGSFYCQHNQLTSLEGISRKVNGICCYGNPLPPEVISDPKSYLKQLNRDRILDSIIR